MCAMNDAQRDFDRFREFLSIHGEGKLVQAVAARAAIGTWFRAKNSPDDLRHVLERWGITAPDIEQAEQVLAAAWRVRAAAYAPYSRFYVGAAVLGSCGRMWCGANVENSSYGLTLCAERAALAAARAAGGESFLLLCIAADTEEPISPCGACRQWIVELAPHALVAMIGSKGAERWCTPSELLPWAFRSDMFHSRS
jgi:cytidine deaminase